MNKTLEKIRGRHPVGQKVQYWNPGKRGHEQQAVVEGYLHRTDSPDRVAYIELSFGTRRHVVTVNQLGKYYNVLP
jgi:hypothetical protein